MKKQNYLLSGYLHYVFLLAHPRQKNYLKYQPKMTLLLFMIVCKY